MAGPFDRTLHPDLGFEGPKWNTRSISAEAGLHSELFFHPIGLLSLTGIRGKPYNGARRAKAAQCAATIRRPRWDSQGGAASGRDRRGNGGSAPLLARESGRLVYDRSNLCEASGIGMSTTSQPGRGI